MKSLWGPELLLFLQSHGLRSWGIPAQLGLVTILNCSWREVVGTWGRGDLRGASEARISGSTQSQPSLCSPLISRSAIQKIHSELEKERSGGPYVEAQPSSANTGRSDPPSGQRDTFWNTLFERWLDGILSDYILGVCNFISWEMKFSTSNHFNLFVWRK